MKIVTGHGGGPHVTANDTASFNSAMFGRDEFVLASGSMFAYEIESNNQIKIKDGDILFQGRHARILPNTTETCVIDNGTQGMSRCDLIVARYAKDVDGIESVQLSVVKGVAGATPISPPYMTGDIAAGDALHEMPLYRVTINGLNIGSVIPLFNTYPKSRRIRSGSVLPSTGIEGDIFLLRET